MADFDLPGLVRNERKLQGVANARPGDDSGLAQDIKESAQKQDESISITKKTMNLTASLLESTKEQTMKFGRMLKEIVRTKVLQSKIASSMGNLDKGMDQQNAQNDETEKTSTLTNAILAKLTGAVGKLKEGAEGAGGMFLSMMGAQGLGGLLAKLTGGGLLGGVLGGAGRGVARLGRSLIPAPVGAAVGGVVRGGAGLAKGIGSKLKGAGRLLGKVALPLAAVMAAFDFADGFGRAGEIAGLKPGEEAKLGTKIQAGAASMISGFTFGLIDEKTVFKGITDITDGLVNAVKILWEGIKKLWGMIADFAIDIFNKVAPIVKASLMKKWVFIKGIGLSVGKWFMDKFRAIWDGVTAGIAALWEFIKGGGLVGMGLRAVLGVDSLSEWFLGKVTAVGDFFKEAGLSLWNWIKTTWSATGDFIVKGLVGFKDWILGGGFVGTSLRSIIGVDSLTEWFTNKVSGIGATFKESGQALWDWISTSVGDFLDMIDPVKLFDKVKTMTGEVMDKIKGLIPKGIRRFFGIEDSKPAEPTGRAKAIVETVKMEPPLRALRSRDARLAARDEARRRQEEQRRPTTIVVDRAGKSPTAARETSVGDLKLAIVNSVIK